MKARALMSGTCTLLPGRLHEAVVYCDAEALFALVSVVLHCSYRAL